MPHAEELKRPYREEARIQSLVGSGGMNRAGILFKPGITVINGHELLEVHRRIEETKAKDKEDQTKAETKEEVTKARTEIEAVLFFWVRLGCQREKLNRQDKLQLSKDNVVAIVKMLLSRLDLTKKLSDYVRKGLCVDWLTTVVSGTTWADEIDAFSKEVLAKATSEIQQE